MTTRLKLAMAVGFQCLILLGLMLSRQWTLTTGETILLQTVPVDPRDLFRGDYVTLSYRISRLERSLPGDTATLEPGDVVFVVLRRAGRYWEASSAHRQRPEIDPGQMVIRGRAMPSWGAQVQVAYGIESYFVPEGSGGDLEVAARRPGGLEVGVAVDRNGQAAIRNVRTAVGPGDGPR